MSKSTKIKTLLTANEIKGKDVYGYLGLARQQALTTKYARDAFSGDDLIKIAKLTNTKLAFIDTNNNPVVIFDENDIKEKDQN